MTAEEALAALPDTAEEIAAFLLEKGHKGIKTAPDSCPIAKYLRSEVEGFTRPVGTKIIMGETTGKDVILPPAVCRFILEFDQCVHKELFI